MKGQRSLLSSTLMAASSSFSQLPWVFLLFSLPLAVNAQPSQPTITGPSRRMNPGAEGKFECNSRGFPSKNITVKWTKGWHRVKALESNVSEESSNSYQINSTVLVQLTEKDIGSKLTCKVQHPSLSKPLEKIFYLNNVLRVAPKVTLTTSHTSPGPVPLNQSVKLTCKADNFYPSNVSVSWWRSDYSDYTKSSSSSKENKNKTFHLHLPLPAQQASKMETTYMCQVVHDNEKIYYASQTLRFGAPPEESACSPASGQFLLFGLWAGLSLGKIVTAVLILHLFWKKSISKINPSKRTKRDSSKRSSEDFLEPNVGATLPRQELDKTPTE